jgi:RimJ/RimL family protein N-acetyltransferase
VSAPPVRAERLTLRDGTRVDVRPIRGDDRARLQRAFDRLSAESRRRRFLVPMARLSSAMLTYLTEVDHHDHEALVALDPATGEGVGVARFVRLRGRREAAEAAVTVADAWQGRGLGTLLVELLAQRARDEGVRRFTALLLADNDDMLDLLARLGALRVVDRRRGTVEVEVQLPEAGVSPELRTLLRLSRAAAAGSAHDGSRPPAPADRARARHRSGTRRSPGPRS